MFKIFVSLFLCFFKQMKHWLNNAQLFHHLIPAKHRGLVRMYQGPLFVAITVVVLQFFTVTEHVAIM